MKANTRPFNAALAKDAAVRIVRRLKEAGHEGYFVGGCVRDLLLGQVPEDYDIVTSARPEQVQRLFPRTVPIGAAFGIIMVLEDDYAFDVATFRRESPYVDGRRPSAVHFGSAEEDVRRRDFTVNGLLMDPESQEILDWVGGGADIRSRLIRTIGNPHERFAEDHLRMLRAVRLAANLDFTIQSETFEAIGAHAKAIGRISAERIRDELTKLLTGKRPAEGMSLLSASGLLFRIIPEVSYLSGIAQPLRHHPEGDVWQHVLRMLESFRGGFGAVGDMRLAWAIVLHDAGKALTQSIDEKGIHFYGHVGKSVEIAETVLRRMKFSHGDRDAILALIRHHMLFMSVKDMRASRLKRFLRMPEFELHLELHRLDCLGSHGLLDHYDFCRERLAALPAEELRPPRLLSGYDLQAMGFTPGPQFSKILQAVETAQLEGKLATPAEARSMVLKHWRPRE